jgi:uncharacterized protein YhaN
VIREKAVSKGENKIRKMEIQELYLKHYGKFENHRILLKPGINIIYGGNEAGKSTIHSFIRAMFFGLSRSRGRAARTDEYQIRQPWDTPGAFLGSMKVRENGEVYRIDRCFDRSTQPLAVFCESRGQEFAKPEQAMDELLGGISESAFVNTVFVPQAQAETDEALALELQRYMVNSDSTLDAQLDVGQALQTLRRKKRALEQKKKKEDEQMEAEIAKKQSSAEQIRRELDFLRRQADRTRQVRRNGLPGQRELQGNGMYGQRGLQGNGSSGYREEAELSSGTDRRLRRILEVLLVLAGILALLGAALIPEWKARVCLGIFGVVFLVFLIPVHLLLRDPEDGTEEVQEDDELSEEIRSREEQYHLLQDELEALYHSHVRLDDTETELAALNLAIDRICELSNGIYEKSGGALGQRASEILCELTGGAYDRIVLDETAQIRIHTPSRVLGLHQVSGGTLQQIYFALRMAAGEVLCEGRELPIVLDETFAMYDEERLEAALRWLKKSGRQVILFTCQKREREILAHLG